MARKPGISRRTTLKAGSAAAVAAACSRGDDTAIGEVANHPEVLVVTMFENRSFDHWFGALSLEEGRGDVDGLTATMSNPDIDGKPVAPFRSTTVSEICLADPPHGWDSCHLQWNKGANDGFCTEYATVAGGGNGAGVMGYLNREDLPISYALADAFTLCDRYFASVMGPTYPNRYYGFAATSDGITYNDFPKGKGFEWRTVFKALDEVGVEWRYYYSNIPVIGLFEGHWDTEKVRPISDFYEDAAEGKLAPVNFVEPAFFWNDAHPPFHPALAELFLASLYEALATSPQWKDLLFLSTFDEHGGFFDHVPPPTIGDEHEGFEQLGFRVPSLAVGPYVKAGTVSEVLDHTSWIRLVCDLHGIEPWNERLSSTRSLAAVLDFDRMDDGDALSPPELPLFDFDEGSLDPACLAGPPVPDDWQTTIDGVRHLRGPVVEDLTLARDRFMARLRQQGLLP